MQDELRHAAEEAGRIDAQRQVTADAVRRMGCDDSFGFGIVPEILHGSGFCWTVVASQIARWLGAGIMLTRPGACQALGVRMTRSGD